MKTRFYLSLFSIVALAFMASLQAAEVQEKTLGDAKTAPAASTPTVSKASPETHKSGVQEKLDQKVAEADKKAEEKGAQARCHLSFTLKSWSVFYKSGKGEGTVTCDNGETANVQIRANGGGVTFGKTHITNGKGSFSKIKAIQELYGTYVSSEAHGGIVKSGDVRAMTKGDVSLAIHGTGRGFDMGIAFGAFKITPM